MPSQNPLPRRDHRGAAAPTTLVTAITGADTTFSISTNTGWPTSGVGPFFVVLDPGEPNEEKILCASQVGGVVTVAGGGRGADGTSAAAHVSGARAYPVWTAVEADEANEHGASVSGVHGVAGAVVGTTDVQTLSNKSISGSANTLSNIAQSAVTNLPADLAAAASPVGSMLPFGGDAAPAGWLLCDGAVVSQGSYAALFAVLGAKFNTGGEGEGNFRLPDMRDRVAVGASGTKAAGTRAGADTVTLTTANSPSHAHASAAHTHTGVDHLHGIFHTHTNPGHQHEFLFEYADADTAGSGTPQVTDIQGWTGAGGTNGPVATDLVTPDPTFGPSVANTGAADRSLTTGSTTPANTGSTGGGTAFSIQNLYVALHHIVKT